jgi:hypothetical protein
MATEKALQLVTLAIADLLRDRMLRTDVSFTFSRPLSPAPGAAPKARLNLYLYQVLENAAFRNEDEPPRWSPGRFGAPPLALSLHYLLTSYGTPTHIAQPPGTATFPAESLIELDAQFILADAMRVLHDVPVISRTTARIGAGPPLIMDPELQPDFESIRLVPKQLSLDELTKLWTSFKEDFQRSVGYEVTVARVRRAEVRAVAPPVLTRNIQVIASASPVIDFVLESSSAAADTNIYFSGNGLDDPSLRIQLSDAMQLGYPAQPVFLVPQVDAQGKRFFRIPSVNPQLQPGTKLVQAVITSPPAGMHVVASPATAITLLPSITSVSPHSGRFDGTITVTIQGKAMGVEPTDPSLASGAMVPTVLFGNYAIPFEDLDLSALPFKVVATLNAPQAGAPPPPQPPTPVFVRIHVNGCESESWSLTNTGPKFRPSLRFTPI